MINGKKVTAIILIAGNSTRFSKNRNKNFELVNGKTVLYYSINMFDKNSYVDNIIVTAKEEDIQTVNNIIKKEKVCKNTKIVLGGSTRKQSVYNAIKNTDAEIVIIHDGARPAIKQAYINNCIENIGEVKGVTIGVKAKDTIKITDGNNNVVKTVKRDNTWMIQTPQCFERELLLQMHQKYKDEDFTDDCVLLEKDNYKVKVIDGDYTNIKITTPEDLDIIKEFLTYKKYT